MLVPDASATLDWMLPGAGGIPASVRRRLKSAPVVVPVLWFLETQNVILKFVRQRKLTEHEASDIRLELLLLSKRVDETPNQSTIDRIWEIATANMMTIYDATYVELAWRLQLPLVTSDTAIRAAAKSLRIELL